MSVARPKGRKSRSRRIEVVHLTCGFCGTVFTPARADAVFCQSACRRAAFEERSHDCRVVAVRRVTSGDLSIILRTTHDTGLRPGQTVRVG